ncbi:hypothetical protein FE257_011168 [Aspergillus nanangensis]|uniref:FMN hydroxy acid dehydrogenase domain-containing protein n=1 Tax=Aspergillus nanangensis TaxID=2582783 RepID=A0AAD4CHV0_ASPNN|nr:hypothetical protein FE257_011168 [Aspergillus nanangensis]
MDDEKNPDSEPATLAELETIASTRLPQKVWQFYADGADEQRTTRRNTSVYDEILLRPRVLRDVRNIDTSTTIFGKRYEVPIAVAPSAYQKLAHPNGEIAVARACHNVGSNFTLSSNATTSLEDVIHALPPRDVRYPAPWFQLYFVYSRTITQRLIERAEKAGYEALVLTVDTVVMGNRLHEHKVPLQLPPELALANLTTIKGGGSSKGRLLSLAKTAADARKVFEEHSDYLVDASLKWNEVIPWLRSHTSMKLILKGIMTAEDAECALKAGVDAIIVSNHGGRQLDGVPPTLEVLPEIVDIVRGRIPVLFDGGIRHGSHVFKALALGADLCLIGRSALWGLTYDGQRGVEAVFHILERELWRTMSLVGASSLKQISKSMVGRSKHDGFGVTKL